MARGRLDSRTGSGPLRWIPVQQQGRPVPAASPAAPLDLPKSDPKGSVREAHYGGAPLIPEWADRLASAILTVLIVAVLWLAGTWLNEELGWDVRIPMAAAAALYEYRQWRSRKVTL